MSDKYSVSVCWNNEDRCFIATCSEFPLLSAHGDSREEAVSEFQIVLEMAIESFTEDNIELPKPKTTASHSGQFRIRVPKSLHKSLVQRAEEENISLNTYVISLLSGNHASREVYTDKIDMLKRIVDNLTTHFASHRDTLQVYTQKLNLLESQSLQKEPPESEWITRPTDKHSYRTYRA